MKDRTTGKSRGFGFVTFQQASDAAHAGNKEHMVDGRRCEVSKCTSSITALRQLSRQCLSRAQTTILCSPSLWQGAQLSQPGGMA